MPNAISEQGPRAGAPLIVVYVSGHGFGHAMRMGCVLHRVHELAPDARIVVRGAAPPWAYPSITDVVELQTDVGVLQKDSLSTSVDETIICAAAFERTRPALVASECAALRESAPAIVVGDIPPLAFDVGAGLGVPTIALGNFAWDWIYANLGSSLPEVSEIVSSIRRSEQRAHLLLRLPLHAEMSAFPLVEDVPFIARVSRVERDTVRRALGIPLERPVALLSFGGFDLPRLDLRAFARTPEITFVTTLTSPAELPPNMVCCDPDVRHYETIIAACDVAIVKPGYGIISDCIANRVPMIFATRPSFPEEQSLIEGLQKLAPATFISHDELFSGDVATAIGRVIEDNSSWQPVRLDGADVVAHRVLDIAGAEPQA